MSRMIIYSDSDRDSLIMFKYPPGPGAGAVTVSPEPECRAAGGRRWQCVQVAVAEMYLNLERQQPSRVAGPGAGRRGDRDRGRDRPGLPA